MLITYKVLHHRTPIYIQELLQLHTPSRNVRSSNRNLLVKPYFNLNLYGKVVVTDLISLQSIMQIRTNKIHCAFL